VKDYDSSILPDPIKSIVKLDYCWRLQYTMFKHSFYLSMPLTMVYFIWTDYNRVWNYKIRTFPYKAALKNYFVCILIVNSINTVWSLAFEDYCKRNSPVYQGYGNNSGNK
jgi:hypothetical protein